MITFLKAQTEKVFVELTTEAFPLFTGDKVLKTTPFTVDTADGIQGISSKQTEGNGKTYNLMGQEVRQAHGIIIRNNKKILVK